MTHDHVSGLANELFEMATAVKRVPELERTVREQEAEIARKQTAIELLKAAAVDYGTTVDNLKTELAKAQEERDSASFRELEAEDKLTGLRRAIEYCQDALGDALRAIEPPKPAEPPKPSYEGKWLTDVMGWSELTLNAWLDCGGTYERFTVVKPVEAQPMVPNEGAPFASIYPSPETQPHSQPSAEPTPASPLPSAESSDVATQEGREQAGEQATALATSIENGSTATSQCAPSFESASQPSTTEQWPNSTDCPSITEADNTSSGPFANTHTSANHNPSPPAPTGDADKTTSAPSPSDDGELNIDWPWSFSRASHVS